MAAIEECVIPPGPAGVAAAWEACERITQSSGPALAFVPPADGTAATSRVRAAMHLDDDAFDDELDGIAAIVATSGSTGNPRGVLFTADAFTALLDGPDRQWIAALPLTSIAGLNVVLRGMQHGRAPIALPSVGGAAPFEPKAVVEAVRATADPAISLVPTQLAACLRDTEASRALADCNPVLVGGAAIPDALLSAASKAGIALTATYGSTETRGGCVWNGHALPGVRVTLDAQHRIVMSGPMLARGYRADPHATREHFANDTFLSNDVGAIDDDGTLTVLGRVDDIVPITGVNVSLRALENVVMGLPGVQQCAAVVMNRDQHTPAVHLWLVAHEGAAPIDEESVKARVRAELGAAAVPRLIHVIDELPLLPNGKVDSRELEHRGDAG